MENDHQMETGVTSEALRSSTQDRDRILIFSPDPDLATSLSMLLADAFSPVVETDLRNFGRRVQDEMPALLLVDLFSSAVESLQQLKQLEEIPAVPIVLLREYRSFSELDQMIKRLKAFYFYKPVDVEKVTLLIAGLLGKRNVRIDR
jgi:DNA-binding NtrC family response regulator